MLTVKGHWEQTWDIIPLSQEELDAIAAAIPEETMKITKLAFRNRFTPAEKVVLYTAAKASVELEVYLDDVNAATFIDLKRADTVVAVQSLELLGIIGEGRAAVILDTPAAVHEVFTG
jgi:hypothetical protein